MVGRTRLVGSDPSAAQFRPVPAFRFDGGAATYIGTGMLAALVTIVTLGISFPFALVLVERWRAKHTYIEGRRLMCRGTAPRVTRWRIEHLAFDPSFQPPSIRDRLLA